MADKLYCYHFADAMVDDVARTAKWLSKGDLSKLWMALYRLCRAARLEFITSWRIEEHKVMDKIEVELRQDPLNDFELAVGKFELREWKVEYSDERRRKGPVFYTYKVVVHPNSVYVELLQPNVIIVHIVEKGDDS